MARQKPGSLLSTAALGKPVALKSLTALWSPMLLLMKVVGAYHCPDPSQKADKQSKTCFWVVNWRVYSLVWIGISGVFYVWRVLYLCFNVGKTLGVDSIHSLIRVYGRVAWTLLMGLIGIVMHVASAKKSGFTRLYELWGQLRYLESEAKSIEGFVKRWVWVLLLIYFPAVVLEITVDTIETTMYEGAYFLPAILPFVFGFIVEGATMFFLILLFLTIGRLFAELNHRVATHFRKNGGVPGLDNFVRNYYVVASMVRHMDDLFSLYLGAYLVYCVIWMVFEVYYSFAFEQTIMVQVFTWFWGLCSVSYCMALLWNCANIPLKADELHLIIHALPLGQFSQNQKSKILSLQQFIGNTTVSFSLFKMHSVTRSLFTSIVGFCLTYVFILIQLRAK